MALRPFVVRRAAKQIAKPVRLHGGEIERPCRIPGPSDRAAAPAAHPGERAAHTIDPDPPGRGGRGGGEARQAARENFAVSKILPETIGRICATQRKRKTDRTVVLHSFLPGERDLSFACALDGKNHVR